MTRTEYDNVSRELLIYATCVADAKRPAYTLGSDDCLINFKSVAERMGVTPLQAWGVYFNKHIDAINSAAKDPFLPQAEAIKGRFADAINYLLLGYALLIERDLASDKPILYWGMDDPPKDEGDPSKGDPV